MLAELSTNSHIGLPARIFVDFGIVKQIAAINKTIKPTL
jgi:hypothetical protein